jgi:hypothetical protein
VSSSFKWVEWYLLDSREGGEARSCGGEAISREPLVIMVFSLLSVFGSSPLVARVKLAVIDEEKDWCLLS